MMEKHLLEEYRRAMADLERSQQERLREMLGSSHTPPGLYQNTGTVNRFSVYRGMAFVDPEPRHPSRKLLLLCGV